MSKFDLPADGILGCRIFSNSSLCLIDNRKALCFAPFRHKYVVFNKNAALRRRFHYSFTSWGGSVPFAKAA